MIRPPEPSTGALAKLMAQHTQLVERLCYERDRAREANTELRTMVAAGKRRLADALEKIRYLETLRG